MILVTLPLRTVSEANVRTHWAKKAKRVKDHRGVSAIAVTAEYVRLCGKDRTYAVFAWRDNVGCVGPVVTLTRIAPRELDDDNLRGALKAVRDGVADALGVNDRDPRVSWAYAQRKGEPKEYGVEIRISPRSAQQGEQPEGQVDVKSRGGP